MWVKKAGSLSIGKNSPDRNNIGNLKKLEKVCASKTSLTDTAMNNPRKVEDTAIRMMLGIIRLQVATERSIRNDAIKIGTKAFAIPKRIAPEVFASIKSSSEIGDSKSLSKERFFFSKVIVTASIEVVPNRTDTDTTPGSRF